MKQSKNKQFLIVGLGLFGTSVAKTLYNLGYDVFAMDSDENLVQNLSSQLPYVVCGDASDKKNTAIAAD